MAREAKSHLFNRSQRLHELPLQVMRFWLHWAFTANMWGSFKCGRKNARITYRSTVPLGAVITGAEEVKNWEHYQGNVWRCKIENSIFGNYNPYTAYVEGDWYFTPGIFTMKTASALQFHILFFLLRSFLLLLIAALLLQKLHFLRDGVLRFGLLLGLGLLRREKSMRFQIVHSFGDRLQIIDHAFLLSVLRPVAAVSLRSATYCLCFSFSSFSFMGKSPFR